MDETYILQPTTFNLSMTRPGTEEHLTANVYTVKGVTDAQGKLVCKTNGNWEGAPAGSYEAMVTKEVPEMEEATEPGASAKIKSNTRYVDQKYNNPKTSGLTAEVKEGDNQIELKVGEKIEENVPVMG